jgi:DNA polymerase III psi subunit
LSYQKKAGYNKLTQLSIITWFLGPRGKNDCRIQKTIKNDTDLILVVYQDVEKPNYLWLYNGLLKSFQMTLDRIGKYKQK